jgi:hypothetical protein
MRIESEPGWRRAADRLVMRTPDWALLLATAAWIMVSLSAVPFLFADPDGWVARACATLCMAFGMNTGFQCSARKAALERTNSPGP